MCNLLNDKKISELCFHNYYITDLPIVNNLFFDGFQPSFEFLKILKQGENKRAYWLIQYAIERYTAPSYYLQSNYNFSAFPTLAPDASVGKVENITLLDNFSLKMRYWNFDKFTV